MRSPSLSSQHSEISFAPRSDAAERRASNKSQAKKGGNSLLQNLLTTLADPSEAVGLVSTPDIHKFRTEMCKNFEQSGHCPFGDRCSFAHSKNQIMVRTDLPVNYKTKLCRKYQLNGSCPYGSRCQFKHGVNDHFARPGRKFSEEIEPKNDSYFAETFRCNVEQAKFDKVPKYADILVHCLNVSVQEHVKKVALYEKKSDGSTQVGEPEYQYMNIYQKATKRLNVFSAIALESSDSEDEDQHFGDAASYEKFLHEKAQSFDCGYMSDPSPKFKAEDFSTLSLSSQIFKPTI